MNPFGRVLLAAGSLVLAVVWVVPVGWVVWTAFRPGFDNFRSVLDSAPFPVYFFNSFVIVVGVLGTQLVTMTLASYAFARIKFWGREVVFTLLLVQMVIPFEVFLVPNYQTVAAWGLTNNLLGIMVPFGGSAFGVFLLRQTFRSIPRDFDDAASLDGCGLWRKLGAVYLPLAQPAYLAFATVSFTTHWNDFLWPLVVTNSDAVRPVTVGLAMFATSFETGARWGEVSAATLLVIAPVVVLFLAFQKHFTASFAASSGLK